MNINNTENRTKKEQDNMTRTVEDTHKTEGKNKQTNTNKEKCPTSI
jgi:hypothetical protein